MNTYHKDDGRLSRHQDDRYLSDDASVDEKYSPRKTIAVVGFLLVVTWGAIFMLAYYLSH